MITSLKLFTRFSFVSLALTACSIATLPKAAEGSTLDVDSLKRGPLIVKVDHFGCGKMTGLYRVPSQQIGLAPIIPALGATLIPPLIESTVGMLGNSLVKASGKSDTTLSVSGLSTSYFYCIERKVERNPATDELEGRNSYFLLPRRIVVSAPMTTSQGQGPAFEAQFDLVLSEDGTAFKLVPTKTNYIKPVFNSRAYGAVIEIRLAMGSAPVVATGVLPLGMVSCGRPYRICQRVDDPTGNTLPGQYVQSLNFASSGWLPLPAGSPTRITGSNKANARLLLTPGTYLGTPLTVSATLTEVSTYDKFLAFWGEFLSANKSTIKESVVNWLPPLTAPDQSGRHAATAERAVAEVEYNVASRTYARLLSSNSACKEQVDAWKAAVKAAIKADIVTSLESNPPLCIGGL
jgi:hypothetical protein